MLKIEEEVCLLVWGVLIIDGIEYQAYVPVNIIVFIIIIQYKYILYSLNNAIPM